MAISVNEEGSFKNLGIEFSDSWRINGVDLVYDDSVPYIGQHPTDSYGYIKKFNALGRAIEFPKPISAYRLLIRYAETIMQSPTSGSTTMYYSKTADNKNFVYAISYSNPKILYEYSWQIGTGTSDSAYGVCRMIGLLFQTLNITGDTTSIKILGETADNGGYNTGDSTTKYWNHSKIFAMY